MLLSKARVVGVTFKGVVSKGEWKSEKNNKTTENSEKYSVFS
jgi:hypothetical protein